MIKDDGVSEVVGFAFVIIIVMFGILMWLLIALPIYGTNDELQHNTAVELDFADLKTDIDTMCLSGAVGIKRQAVIYLAPSSDKSKITTIPDLKTLKSYGSVSLKKSPDGKLIIAYTSSNTYVDDITVVYYNGAMYSYEGDVRVDYSSLGTPFMSDIGYNIVVDDYFEDQIIGGNEAVIITYQLTEINGNNCKIRISIS